MLVVLYICCKKSLLLGKWYGPVLTWFGSIQQGKGKMGNIVEENLEKRRKKKRQTGKARENDIYKRNKTLKWNISNFVIPDTATNLSPRKPSPPVLIDTRFSLTRTGQHSWAHAQHSTSGNPSDIPYNTWSVYECYAFPHPRRPTPTYLSLSL